MSAAVEICSVIWDHPTVENELCSVEFDSRELASFHAMQLCERGRVGVAVTTPALLEIPDEVRDRVWKALLAKKQEKTLLLQNRVRELEYLIGTVEHLVGPLGEASGTARGAK